MCANLCGVTWDTWYWIYHTRPSCPVVTDTGIIYLYLWHTRWVLIMLIISRSYFFLCIKSLSSTHENLKWYFSETFMPCTVKWKPLENVCLDVAFRNICRGHSDIMVVHSQYMDSVFYLKNTDSLVPTMIGIHGVTTSLPIFLKA